MRAIGVSGMLLVSGCTYDYLAALGDPPDAGAGGAAAATSSSPSSTMSSAASTGGGGGSGACVPCLSEQWEQDLESCSCYLYVDAGNDGVAHSDAICNSPLKLAGISSPEETAFLIPYLDKKLAYAERAWIGLKRKTAYVTPPENCSCDWCWANEEPCLYTNWAPSEPVAGEDCVVVGEGGNWHSKDCSEKMKGHLCEYNPGMQ